MTHNKTQVVYTVKVSPSASRPFAASRTFTGRGGKRAASSYATLRRKQGYRVSVKRAVEKLDWELLANVFHL